jgi:hypothetical protein
MKLNELNICLFMWWLKSTMASGSGGGDDNEPLIFE